MATVHSYRPSFTDHERGNFISKYNVGWRRVVRNFSPSWFSTTMGTGIVAVLFRTLPYESPNLHYLSIVFFILNVVIFVMAFATSILRYTLYPEIWTVMIRDPTNSLFLATMPMGFATLVEMWVFICVPLWGEWARTLAWALWIVDTIAAAFVTLGLSFILFVLASYLSYLAGFRESRFTDVSINRISQSHIASLERITALQLLPIAATIVAAGTGAEVAEILPNHNRAMGTVLVSYILWGMCMPLALTILVIYYHRLALHKLPPRETIGSCFLPLGPLGFGGYSILYLGKVCRILFQHHSVLDPIAGSVAYVIGVYTSLLMWSFGLIWFIFALATVSHRFPFPFNMGWWGFTFPLGVYSANTIQLGKELDLGFFKILGTIFSSAVMILWLVVAARTALGAWKGNLFIAPCVQELKENGDDHVR